MVPADVLENKREIGLATHIGTELIDKGALVEGSVHELIVPYLNGYKQFIKDHPHYVVVDSETRIFHTKYRYAGCLDRRAYLFDALSMIDIKCTYDLMPSVGPQTAAYTEAVNWGTKEKVKKRYALRLLGKEGRDGKLYVLHECKDTSDFNTFNILLKAYVTVNNWKVKYG